MGLKLKIIEMVQIGDFGPYKIGKNDIIIICRSYSPIFI